ncbi:inositol monophosphatase family protein [Nocardioides sp.]|uniref:inositol monophosphatase family protein n=1 Tax=Nocardioides sp. TaxID=35761 RepID=UPI00352758FB
MSAALAVTPELREELLRLALDVAREAAELIRRERAAGVEVAATKTSLTDVVTRVDHDSERLIRGRLLGARPGDGFLGEEGGRDESDSGVRWVVDPIDGTVNFLYGLPQYAVSIAAEVDGVAQVGVVLNVPTGVTYWAVLGGGAHRDGTPLRVREPAPLSQRLVITGFNYEPPIRALQAQAIARLLPVVRDIRRPGSAALDLCHVAEGAADGYVEEGLNPWDHAAGGLVAREAGARTALMTGIGGLTLMVCAPEHGFEEFLATVTEVGLVAADHPG